MEHDDELVQTVMDPIHRDAEWRRFSSLLRDGEWWTRICHMHQPKHGGGGHLRRPTPVLLGLGSKESNLAEVAGIEPTGRHDPSHSF